MRFGERQEKEGTGKFLGRVFLRIGNYAPTTITLVIPTGTLKSEDTIGVYPNVSGPDYENQTVRNLP